MSDGTVIELVDRYLDAAPRSSADAVDTGAFTLFVGRGPWSYYARPALASVGPLPPPTSMTSRRRASGIECRSPSSGSTRRGPS
jgi:hypothetical protein